MVVVGEFGVLMVWLGSGEFLVCGGVLMVIGCCFWFVDFGLNVVGVVVENGCIMVDVNFCILVFYIYVVGDVIDWVNFMFVVIDEGCVFVDSVFGLC